MEKKPNIPPNVEGLATLLVLQDQVKNLKTLKEFGFFVTNETHRLLPYHTAFLWEKSEFFNVQLLDQSEIREVDLQSPVSQWLTEAIMDILKIINPVTEIQALNFAKMGENTENYVLLGQKIVENWPKTLPRYALWCPLLDASNEISGGLILFRESPFSEQEIKMFRWLGNNYRYTWLVLTQSKFTPFQKWIKNKPYIKILCVIVILIMLFPTRLSVVSNAIVESSAEAPINATISGTIKEFLVKPGDSVKAGQLLIVLDKMDLLKSLAISEKKVLLSEAKLRSANNLGFEKPENRNEIPILEAELAIDQAEVDFTKLMISKTEIKSPIDGVAVFESKESWVGQPVQTGENIMNIEDLTKVQLRISIPVPDLITLEVGSEGKFYAYGELSEVPVTLTELGYNAKLMPNKILAYQFIAKFDNPQNVPRIGTEGTAHVYGRPVPFIYYLLRRPLQTLRRTFGF